MNAARTIFISLLLLAGPCGCASDYRRLISERSVPELAALLDDAAAYPNSTHMIPTTIGNAPPLCVSLRETGNRGSDRVLVLIHGCLSDHRTWRFVRGALAREYRLVLVDLPGCGESDRPDPEMLGHDGYSPDALAERILQALAVPAGRWGASTRITLVGHSLGGLIALRMMASPELRGRHGALLHRVDGMVLFSPADISLVHACPALHRLASLDDLDFAMADFLGILKREVAQGTIDAASDPNGALREEADRVLQILRDRKSRRTQLAIVRQAIPHDLDGDRDWARIERLEAEYANVQVPCMIAWGTRDDVVEVSHGYKLATQLPTTALRLVPECRHSVQVERPELCAEMVRDFVDRGEAGDLGTWSHPGARVSSHSPGKVSVVGVD